MDIENFVSEIVQDPLPEDLVDRMRSKTPLEKHARLKEAMAELEHNVCVLKNYREMFYCTDPIRKRQTERVCFLYCELRQRYDQINSEGGRE